LYFKKEKPDIVLMDIQMPNKMDMKQREILILWVPNSNWALTAGIMIDEKEKCFESGMNDYLSKPITVSDLKKLSSG
jgi:CheY-like chemotaxis protein